MTLRAALKRLARAIRPPPPAPPRCPAGCPRPMVLEVDPYGDHWGEAEPRPPDLRNRCRDCGHVQPAGTGTPPEDCDR